MYDLNLFNLGEKIRNLRKKNNLSLEEFGKKIGKSKPTIYKYEENDIVPDIYTLLCICNIFEVSISDFFEFKSISSDNTKSINPFGTNTLFLYYKGFNKKLVISTITVEELDSVQKVVFKNSKKNKDLNQSFVNEYIGSLEADKQIAYFNLKNDPTSNSRFEKIQIIIDLKHCINDKYIGSINATTDSNQPTFRKCILTKEKVFDRDEINQIFDDLEITENELKLIKENSFWNMPINTLE
ncbi:MAG: helix-turn-helix transcriptional regulator [Clostridia bacterium]|nr:helix-turn-helix transcriptional regulator [Clostridia bacterium]